MALIDPEFDRFLLRVIRALGSYRTEVVLIGGCANALYRYHPHASSTTVKPLVTFDLDVASPNRLPEKEVTLQFALANAGLLSLPEGQRSNKYKTVLTANECMELLCPLTGIPKAVRDRSPSLVDVQSGCTAEALDYVDLLLRSPWAIDLRAVSPLGVTETLLVCVPNPVSYIMQKLLIRSRRRSSARRAKDSYYIYEIAVLFRNALPALTANAQKLSQQVPAKWSRDYIGLAETLFGHLRAEGTQEA
jgi:hypothetical protein